MSRNMSFMLTTKQIRNKTKTVTRRLGWAFLKKGDVLNACVKCQGLKKGEHIEKICQIRVVSTGWEPLSDIITQEEVTKEGFPDLSPAAFIAMFCKYMETYTWTLINRIEFEYV